MSPVIAKQALEFLTVSNCHAFKSRTNVEGMVNQCRPRSGDNSYNEVCSASKNPQKNVVSMRATKQTKDEFVRGSLLLSLTSKYRKMRMSGSSRRFASCVFPLRLCSIYEKKIDLQELFIIKKEVGVIAKKKYLEYLSIKNSLKQHCHICLHCKNIFSLELLVYHCLLTHFASFS